MNGCQEYPMSGDAPVVNPIILTGQKECTQCHETKPLSDFYKKPIKDKVEAMCKKCAIRRTAEWVDKNREKAVEYDKKWYAENKERTAVISRAYYKANKETIKQRSKEWAKNNPEKRRAGEVARRELNREHLREYKKKWRSENVERCKENREKWLLVNKPNRKKKEPQPRVPIDPQIRIDNNRKWLRKTRSTDRGHLNHNMSARMNSALKGMKKGKKWQEISGYSIEKLMKHLEKQFRNGMTWKNYGSYWHVDHIIPVAAFNYSSPDDIDFKKCWSLKNLQPLEATKNVRKQAKIDKPFQPSLTIAA
jgi:hypothetical protein